MLGTYIHRLSRRVAADRGVRVGVTLGLVGVAVLIRLALQPVFGANHVYVVFYLAVILAAYIGGRRAGLLAMVLSAAAAYWIFAPPVFHLKLNAVAFAPLVFFAANVSVAICLISGLNEALQQIAREQGRSEAEARHNADMFRELNERVSHHLQLVAGVLALQAHDEPEAKVAEALAKASETSLLLARAHRDFTGRGGERIAFLPFARHLVDAKLASGGLPPESIELSGEDLVLPADQATSLGAALLECVGVLLSRREATRLKLEFCRRGEGVALRIAEADAAADATFAPLADDYLWQAVIEQLGAQLAVVDGECGGALEILFRSARSSPAELAGATLH
jgi:hypothetical protein